MWSEPTRRRSRRPLYRSYDDAYEYEMLEREIQGTDNRVRILNTAVIPHRFICFIGTGNRQWGTGTLIAPNTILTAGHVIAAALRNVRIDQIEVIPARSGNVRPVSTSTAVAHRLAPAFREVTPTDYGALYLQNPIGLDVGYWTLGYNRHPGDSVGTAISAEPLLTSGGRFRVTIAGYPADQPRSPASLFCHNPAVPAGRCAPTGQLTPGRSPLCGSFQFIDIDRIVRINNGLIEHVTDTCPGNSGSPVWINRPAALGGRQLVGVHVGGITTGNFAVRITPGVLSNIRRWLAQAPTSPTPRPTLRLQSRGNAVRDLQIRLNRWLLQSPWMGRQALNVDGIFGPRTRDVVMAFQLAWSLGIDGVVGRQVWQRLLTLP